MRNSTKRRTSWRTYPPRQYKPYNPRQYKPLLSSPSPPQLHSLQPIRAPHPPPFSAVPC